METEFDGGSAATNSDKKEVITKNLRDCDKLRLISSKFPDSYCQHIRCLNCDHLIMHFLGRKWAESADYLFFRLNFPNRKKLETKLLRDADFSCYCCQCHHINVDLSKPSKSSKVNHSEIKPEWQCCGHWSRESVCSEINSIEIRFQSIFKNFNSDCTVINYTYSRSMLIATILAIAPILLFPIFCVSHKSNEAKSLKLYNYKQSECAFKLINWTHSRSVGTMVVYPYSQSITYQLLETRGSPYCSPHARTATVSRDSFPTKRVSWFHAEIITYR